MTSLSQLLNDNKISCTPDMSMYRAAELLTERGLKLCHCPGKGWNGFYTLPLTTSEKKDELI